MPEKKTKPTKSELLAENDRLRVTNETLAELVAELQQAEITRAEADQQRSLQLQQAAVVVQQATEALEDAELAIEEERLLFGGVADALAVECQAVFGRLVFAFNTIATAASYEGDNPETPRAILQAAIDELTELVHNGDAYEPDDLKVAALASIVGVEAVAQAEAALEEDALAQIFVRHLTHVCDCDGACGGAE